ncbi:MAG: ABC transporter permease [Micrococcales bacterium]|nr:ABC transporter permease [Micrococcales bacterium]
MRAAIRAEYRKIFSTRLWWILALSMAGYIAAMALLMVAALHFGSDEMSHGLRLTSRQIATLSFSIVLAIGYVFPALVGAMTVTQEFRHKTLTPTYLVQPHRGTVLSAKVIAALPMGLAFAVIGLVAAASGSLLLLILGEPTYLSEAATWQLIGRSLIAMTLWAMVGVGFGALITNQVVVIVVLLALSQLVEPLLRMLPSMTGRDIPLLDYLPSAAADSIMGDSFYGLMADGSGFSGLGGLLPPWAGGLVLLAWGLVPAVIGHFTTLRHDVS